MAERKDGDVVIVFYHPGLASYDVVFCRTLFCCYIFFLGGRRELCMMMVLKKVHGNCTAVGCVGVNMSLKTGSVG